MCCCNTSVPQYLHVELVAPVRLNNNAQEKKQNRNHFTSTCFTIQQSSIHGNYQFYFTFLWTFIFAIYFSDPWSFLLLHLTVIVQPEPYTVQLEKCSYRYHLCSNKNTSCIQTFIT